MLRSEKCLKVNLTSAFRDIGQIVNNYNGYKRVRAHDYLKG